MDPAYSEKLKMADAWVHTQEEKDHSSTDDVQRNSIVVYLGNILKSSFRRSFLKTKSSKSSTRIIIRIFFSLFCLIGFLYQTVDFLCLYLSYPTVGNVLIYHPPEVPQPAITICNKNIERRTAVCFYSPQLCSRLNPDPFCMQYPKYCPSIGVPNTAIPFPNLLITNEWEWDDQLEVAHNESMISRCLKDIEGLERKCDASYERIPVVTPNGAPNFCYVIDSLRGKPNLEPDTYPNTFTIKLDLNTQPEEYVIYTEPASIQIAIHDRRKIVNPFLEGYTLKGGVQYRAIVSMTGEDLLPAPYDTKCTDYLGLWKKNNGTGPVNDLMCIEKCKLDAVRERGECIDKYVAYPHMYKLCKRGKLTTTFDIIEKCTKSCRKACSDYQYQVKLEETGNFVHLCRDEWCMNSKIKLTLHFNQFRVTKFQHQPKFQTKELFNNLLSYIIMWTVLAVYLLCSNIDCMLCRDCNNTEKQKPTVHVIDINLTDAKRI